MMANRIMTKNNERVYVVVACLVPDCGLITTELLKSVRVLSVISTMLSGEES